MAVVLLRLVSAFQPTTSVMTIRPCVRTFFIILPQNRNDQFYHGSRIGDGKALLSYFSLFVLSVWKPSE